MFSSILYNFFYFFNVNLVADLVLGDDQSFNILVIDLLVKEGKKSMKYALNDNKIKYERVYNPEI